MILRLWPTYVIAMNNLATVTDNESDIEVSRHQKIIIWLIDNFKPLGLTFQIFFIKNLLLLKFKFNQGFVVFFYLNLIYYH